MSLSRSIADEKIVYNYVWHRLNRYYLLDSPKYTVSPLKNLIHSYHKQMPLDRISVLEEVVDHIYNNKHDLRNVLCETLSHIQAKNTTGSALTTLYIAFSTAENVCSCRS